MREGSGRVSVNVVGIEVDVEVVEVRRFGMVGVKLGVGIDVLEG